MIEESNGPIIAEAELSKIISKYSLEFKVNEAKWMLNSSLIPTCEKMINDTFGFSIQKFNSGTYKFCVHKMKDGKMQAVLDARYYQQVLDPFHKFNDFGSIETIQRCVDHLLQEVRIIELEESLSDLVSMSNTWGREWFNDLTWGKVEKAKSVLAYNTVHYTKGNVSKNDRE